MSALTARLERGVMPWLRRAQWDRLLIHLVLLAGAFVMIIPFLWMVTLSLKPVELTHQPPYLFPTRFELDNYTKAWDTAPFGRYYLNSIIMTAGIVLGQVVFS
jgi:multiple sugar transport system permease protein